MRHALRLLLLAMALLLFSSPAANAQESGDDPLPVIDVLQISGFVDPIVAETIEAQIEKSTNDGSEALIFQVNSPGELLDPAESEALYKAMDDATIPMGLWIGSSSSVTAGAVELLAHVDFTGLAPGGDLQVSVDDPARVGSQDALAADLVDSDAATLGDFVLAMIDAEVLDEDLAIVVDSDGEPRRELVAAVRFHKVPLFKGFLHSVASPQIAYLMLLAGLGLLLLEFFTAGVGIAGLTGVTTLLLSAYGLGVLPINPWALGLLMLSTVAFGVDIQAGVPRFWTGVGTVLLLIGSFNLFDGIGNSWITLLAGITGFLLTMLVAIPSLVRSRFSTTTIGREWMIGEMGEAVSDVDPSGTVRIQQALWKATTNRATPIATGDPVRVVGIDGVFLEIEPETGGAKDYREMRSRPS